jgi:Ran GTPase-activating protein (RanGAP) involved in mRNA processing and transport
MLKASELAALVAPGGNLRVLKIAYNRVRCNGAEALANSLAAGGGSSRLFALDLRGNFVQKRGVAVLLHAMVAATELKRLDIRDAVGNSVFCCCLVVYFLLKDPMV